jgi:predicted anti-sigma-YlaC factor YlaD
MLIPNHPHDERLSALASGDPEAVADIALAEHVASCHRCTDTVAELGALRASLAELPDLRPHRPLQLLPPVTDAEPSRLDRAGGWARRFFAPVLTAGAALAMVGLVGTTAPLLGGMASQADSAPLEVGDAVQEAQPDPSADPGAQSRLSYGGSTAEPTSAADGDSAAEAAGEMEPFMTHEDAEGVDNRDSGAETTSVTTEERSLWPMLLFAGVALMVAAALMRWILAPRAG